jgi:hypothetical protein
LASQAQENARPKRKPLIRDATRISSLKKPSLKKKLKREKKKEWRNQQRRMSAPPAASTVADSKPGTAQQNAIANGDAGETACARRAKLRRLLTGFNPACTIVTRKPSAARADKSAVTGPWTTEYGPCIAGKKKIVSTQRTVTTVGTTRLRSIRPEYIHNNYMLAVDFRAHCFCGNKHYQRNLDGYE